jgi:protein tyrosine phosphatase (PTP) superfamily phosphohydrolase (DUF442 family)
MLKALFLLVPALVLQAQESAIPGAVEVRPGIFVLRGVPDQATCTAAKNVRLTYVIDLRRDGESNLNSESEASHLQDVGIQYIRYAVGKVPPAADFDYMRTFLNTLPRGARILIHCSNGNRAAAMVCPWLVLDKGMALEEAFRIARNAGLQFQETQDAVRSYLGSKGRV